MSEDGKTAPKPRDGAHPTPMLDELETGPWPSFVTGLKRLRDAGDKQYAPMMNDLLGQLEHSYEERLGFWKGGTVSVFGYGGGVIPRFSEVAAKYPASKEFHTLRVQPPAGYHYTTDLLRQLCDIWEKHGSGPDRLPRPERRHHVPGLLDRERAEGLRRAQRNRLRPRRRRPGAPHIDELRWPRALRDVLLRRGQGAPLGDQRVPRRDAPPGAAVQVQVQVLRLRQRLRQRDPSRRLRRDRHLARRHEGRPGSGQDLRRRARPQVHDRRRHFDVPDARAEPQRRRHARRRQQVLRALHALPQRDEQGALARRRPRRRDSDRRQAFAEGRRSHGHGDRARS